jgi:phage antirepressor YoqD-like protein
VKRTIERLQDKGLIQLTPMVEVKNHLGQVVTEYQLIKRDTYVVVAQLSPEFTARLVDRWQELENQQNPTALLPQNYLQALEQLVASEKEKQALALENKAMKPKADFVDLYVDIGTTKSLRETAKILNMPEKAMIAALERDKALYRQSGNLIPYSDKQSRGLFTVKTGTAEHGHNFTQTRVTSKGIQWIAQRYASELML